MTIAKSVDQHRPYIIYTYPFEETSGGILALHLLCERLNASGETALLWPSGRPPLSWPTRWRSLKDLIKFIRQKVFGNKFALGHYKAPIAKTADIRNSIIVYPEVISDNPIGAINVVRWFLHRPGYHTGIVRYGGGEIYFFYQDAFNDTLVNTVSDNRLTLTYLNPVYYQTNFGERQGTCYLLRKGKDRAKAIDFGDQLCVDDLTHAEKAKAFNTYKYLHSFDTYSMYSVFAAMCGCIPVIEPEEGVSRDEWFPNEVDRYGLAYGWDNVAWAEQTQSLLFDKLSKNRDDEDIMLRNFVEKTQAFFANCS